MSFTSAITNAVQQASSLNLEGNDPMTGAENDLPKHQQYWLRVRSKAAELDPEASAQDAQMKSVNPLWKGGFVEASRKAFYLVSLANAEWRTLGGRMFTANTWTAAKSLVNGTHRLAEPEEIEAYNLFAAKRKAAIEKSQEKDKGAMERLADALEARLNPAPTPAPAPAVAAHPTDPVPAPRPVGRPRKSEDSE